MMFFTPTQKSFSPPKKGLSFWGARPNKGSRSLKSQRRAQPRTQCNQLNEENFLVPNVWGASFSIALLLISYSLFPLSAHALQATAEGTTLSVTIKAESFTAFQPNPTELWVATPEKGGPEITPALAERTAVKVEKLRVSGGQGVKITTPVERPWHVEGGPGAWVITNGSAKGSPSIGQMGYTKVKEGLLLTPSATAEDTKGTRYALVWSGNAANKQAKAFLPATLMGLVAQPSALASTAGNPTAQPLHAAPSSPSPSPTQLPSPTMAAAPMPEKQPGKPVESLKALATPTGKHAAKVEEVKDALKTETIKAYLPGTVVSWTLPPEWQFQKGTLTRAGQKPNVEKQKEVAATLGATADAIAAADNAVKRPSPSAPEISASAPLPHGELPEKNLSRTSPARGISPSDIPPETALPPVVIDAGSLSFPHVSGTQAYLPTYWKTMANLTRALRSSKENQASPAVIGAREKLASFFLTTKRPEEALEIINLMPQKQEQPTLGRAKVLKGLALVAMNRPKEALDALETTPDSLKTDANLWKSVALSKQGRAAEALKTWPSAKGILPKYPAYLREMALLEEAKSLASTAAPAEAGTFISAVMKDYPDPEKIPPAFVRLKARTMLGTEKEPEALEMLSKVSENTTDPATANWAKFDFVQTLYKRREIDSVNAAKYLEDIRLFWRGDDLEQACLRELGRIYASKGQYREAMSRWHTLVKAFPDSPDIGAVSDEMTKAMLKAFDPENPHVEDPLTYLGLYYDFRELLPADSRGDRVTERVGSLLVQVGLYDKAIAVLEPLLRFRTTIPVDQARLALLLARAYRLNGQADMAYKTLDIWRNTAKNTIQAENFQVETARTLLALHQTKEAAQALGDNQTDAAQSTAADIAWQTENWPQLELLTAQTLAGASPTTELGQKAYNLALLRHAYALEQQGKTAALDTFQKRFAEILSKDPQMGDNVGALAVQAGVSNTNAGAQPLGQVAAAMAGLNGLMETIRNRKSRFEIDEKEQEEYNNRMKYMELLPPPAI